MAKGIDAEMTWGLEGHGLNPDFLSERRSLWSKVVINVSCFFKNPFNYFEEDVLKATTTC